MLLFVFFISLLIVAQHVSGNHVPIIRSWRLRDVIASYWYVPWLQGGCQDRLAGSASMDALPTNRTWPSSCNHGTYQHEAITSRSRQPLMMGTWLPETCWATIRKEIKNTKCDSSMDSLPANRTWQPPCSHGTYQHEAITSRSRQLLMMGTWLPETCWATIRREKKIRKVTSSWFFLSTHDSPLAEPVSSYRCNQQQGGFCRNIYLWSHTDYSYFKF